MIGRYTEYYLICDICDIDGSCCGASSWLPDDQITRDNYDKSLEGFMKKKDLMTEAKKWGWKTKYNPLRHICPKCQKEEKNGIAEKERLGKQ